MTYQRIIGIIIILISCNALNSCQNNDQQAENGKLNITATTGIIKDAIENIAKDRVNLVALMGPGVDPHLYKTSYRDIEKLSDADIIFYNGLHLEGKMQDVLQRLSRNKKVYAISDGIPKKMLRNIPGGTTAHDPHIWFNVILWQHAVRHIGKKLIEADPINKDFYEENQAIYLKKLSKLDSFTRAQIETIPPAKRVLITAHDAFGYFGDEYDIEVKGLQGISTMSDFGLNDISSLVNLISKRGIKAIFVETSVARKSIDAVIEGCEQRGSKIKIGGSLYSDALGDRGSPEGTYIGMVLYNVTTIVNSLK
ncbi:MAG TPA: zinc ABC transporter substrate-binding protein [Cytophagaceae bacterium]